MNSMLLTGGRVIDPANRFDAVADVLVVQGKIAALGNDLAGRRRCQIGYDLLTGLIEACSRRRKTKCNQS